MRAELITLRDPFNPGRRDRRTVARRRRIRALAPRTPLPHICYLNGRPILRTEWRRRVADGDVVAFVVLPAGGGGGGGKNPMQLVVAIAMMAVSGPLATSLLGAELAGTAVLGEITLGKIVGAAIGFAGNAIIGGAFAGKPSLPTPQAQAALAAPSPTYNLQAQGNLARLEAAIPVQYGRMVAYPDFAAQPYAEFAGNEQYLYQLLCLGQGYYEIEQLRIEDTDIGNFPDITYEVIEPGESLTLFPSNVVTSTEVSGQTLDYDTWFGPYVANAASTTANAIAIDVVCPRGLYYANDSGGLSAVAISFTVEARAIDNSGAPLGSYVTLATETLTAATNTPQRYSFRYTVTAARYEVRVKRTTAEGGTSRYGDELTWFGLRAYLPETTTFPGKTLIAMRLRASNSLSAQASRKLNVIATRKLPIYSEGVWTSPQVTRSPAWAFADVLRASYGAALDDSRIDIAQLVTLAATYAARGDTFDARFDQTLVVWEALQKIGQAVRTKAYLQGGIVHFARDEAASVPVAMFSAYNILPGSLVIDYAMPTAETADSITARYFDGTTWSWESVTATLPSGSTAQPLKVDLFGVTNREQAYREAMYLAAVNRYRRKTIRFSTEMEGFIPSFGDLIAIAHDMPAWGASGEVVAYNAGTKAITLSEPVAFAAGTYYIGLRKPGGAVSGPYVVTAGADAYEVIHTGTLDFTPETDGSMERTHFAFGVGETWRQPARVVAVRPRSLTEVEIEAINEDDSVHTADEGISAPAAVYSNLPNLFTRPVVTGLTARSKIDDVNTALVSWAAAPGARYYQVDVSSDGNTWTRVGEPQANNFVVPAVYGSSTLIRVAAVGMTAGPAIQISYGAVGDYMWNASSSTTMWNASSSTPMWT